MRRPSRRQTMARIKVIPIIAMPYLCPICVAATAMANALASTPPAWPLALSNITVDRKIEDMLALVEPSRGAFQPRGPPIS